MKFSRAFRVLAAVGLLAVLGLLPMLAGCGESEPSPSSSAPSSPSSSTPESTVAAQSMELSCVTIAPESGSMADELHWWSDEIAKRTNGAVTVKVYWAGSLVGAKEMADAITTGTADIGHLAWSVFYQQLIPLHTITVECSAYQGSPVATWAAFEQLTEEFPEFQAELEAVNMVRLSHHGNYGAGIIMSSKPIKTLKDFKGLKLASTAAKDSRLLEGLGAAPTFMLIQDTLDAVQKGVIDGELTIPGSAVRFKSFEASKYCLRVETPPVLLSDTGFANMMNMDTWNKLSPDVQKVFRDLQAEYPEKYGEFDRLDTENAFAVFEENGVEINTLSPAECQQFADMLPATVLQEDWVKRMAETGKVTEARAKEMLDRYLELIAEHEKTYPPIYK